MCAVHRRLALVRVEVLQLVATCTPTVRVPAGAPSPLTRRSRSSTTVNFRPIPTVATTIQAHLHVQKSAMTRVLRVMGLAFHPHARSPAAHRARVCQARQASQTCRLRYPPQAHAQANQSHHRKSEGKLHWKENGMSGGTRGAREVSWVFGCVRVF